ncbi:sporulation induced hypothetical protein [Phytophthora infestans T30-4]|uniref:Uncharacterized protein n=2 Tax=Phytophthora infestans TaxID=4787 RepID=D0NTP9_PHYIT|nr:sporulation induced hypothetical protein [Phytophthora infestans T30-4]EEY65011.1 sporulation induced hypothetical protein [Phytophthora infestans T30-4]KAF4041446.1 hypothetical protein GN244_ATG06301 [Phytophthora infestans]KAF4130987.1 hypothetical protein GN958_ATG19837 [Phytophthora infestans]KAI9991677.1 hypothetical protein PInf_017026 [Phytophthora infestans]|eukprot:XP_002897499.1 sporulation induced hypothetical protein [Phytophthora infestans T30-4]
MGKAIKRTLAVEQEFSKLEMLLLQTANDTSKCLKILKRNLSKYDRRHGLFFRSTSNYFMRNDIRVAKDTTTDLRYVAKRIKRSKSPTKSEINAARISMNATVDAMNDLKQAGRIFDQNNDVLGGVTGIIESILHHDDNDDSQDDGGIFGDKEKNTDENKTKRGLFGRKKRGGFLKATDTVEGVVKSTLSESFSGFPALKQQITATENALSPSIVTRAKDAMVGAASKLVSSSPTATA